MVSEKADGVGRRVFCAKTRRLRRLARAAFQAPTERVAETIEASSTNRLLWSLELVARKEIGVVAPFPPLSLISPIWLNIQSLAGYRGGKPCYER